MVSSFGRLFYIADEAPISLVGDHNLPDKWFVTARDAFNGVLLWKVPINSLRSQLGQVKSSGRSPSEFLQHLWYEWKDVFVIDGLVWTWSAETAREPLETNGRPTKTMSLWPVSANGYDLKTGKLTRDVPLGDIFKTYHHHRCYRDKATVRYILASRHGTEFVDLEQGNHTIQNWVRGTCHVGMMPANGLQYAPPHPCVCYIDEKLNGMNALAPRSQKSQARGWKSERLEKGPAYKEFQVSNLKSQVTTSGGADWPAYRHDSLRSGDAQTEVPATLKVLWQSAVGKKLSAPVVADGRVFVALIDEHHVAALDADDGHKIWESAAGARVDSPPTCYRGMVIFGSNDGWVYCLRATDGVLVWRFAAAPQDRRIGATLQRWQHLSKLSASNGCAAGHPSG